MPETMSLTSVCAPKADGQAQDARAGQERQDVDASSPSTASAAMTTDRDPRGASFDERQQRAQPGAGAAALAVLDLLVPPADAERDPFDGDLAVGHDTDQLPQPIGQHDDQEGVDDRAGEAARRRPCSARTSMSTPHSSSRNTAPAGARGDPADPDHAEPRRLVGGLKSRVPVGPRRDQAAGGRAHRPVEHRRSDQDRQGQRHGRQNAAIDDRGRRDQDGDAPVQRQQRDGDERPPGREPPVDAVGPPAPAQQDRTQARAVCARWRRRPADGRPG